VFGDITAIEGADIPAHDILAAGFPCQPFTRRGERGGFGDGRGGLFLEIPRILVARKPAGFLLENVWNLQYIDGGHWDRDSSKCVYGHAFRRVLACLEQAGYEVESKVLDARGWVPQARRRIFLVGFRSDLASEARRKFRWPRPQGGGAIQDILEGQHSAEARSCELTEHQWAAVQRSSTWRSGGERLRFVSPGGVASTLTSSYKASFANVAQLVAPALSGLDRPRFLTRRECARLMGFGEDHDVGNPRCPNRAYHQLGNAVCPPLIAAIAQQLARSLNLAQASPEDGSDDALEFAADATAEGAGALEDMWEDAPEDVLDGRDAADEVLEPG